MDELTDRRIVPCRNLAWCFDLWLQKNINPEIVLHRISFPIEYLQKPGKIYLLAKLGNYIQRFAAVKDGC